MVFYGTWEVTIDDKRRILLPKAFREGTTDLYVYVDEGKMLVYAEDKSKNLPIDKLHLFFPRKVDRWGRLLIPEPIFLAVFKDSKKVVLQGWGDHFKCHGG